MKPIIGINLCLRSGTGRLDQGFFLKRIYIEAVIKAGGLPFLLPVIEETDLIKLMMEKVDGLLMTGGDSDIHASIVGKTDKADRPHYLQDLKTQNPIRHIFDLAVCRLALEKNMPVLGVCRGHQTLNEAAGGSMLLDLDQVTSLQHYQAEPGDKQTHAVIFKGDCKLKSIFLGKGKQIWVNSLHRQAVDKPAPGFMISSSSPDGVVESIESLQHDFAHGVQFHPEMLIQVDRAFGNIYKSLVAFAGKYREKQP